MTTNLLQYNKTKITKNIIKNRTHWVFLFILTSIKYRKLIEID